MQLSVGQIGANFINGNFTWGTYVEETPRRVYMAVKKFQMKVRQKERVLDSAMTEQLLPGAARHFNVEDLEVNGTFLVQIQAISEHDDYGLWCPEVRFLTLNDVKGVGLHRPPLPLPSEPLPPSLGSRELAPPAAPTVVGD